MIQGVGFKGVQGAGRRVQGSEFTFQGSQFRIEGGAGLTGTPYDSATMRVWCAPCRGEREVLVRDRGLHHHQHGDRGSTMYAPLLRL